MFSNAFNGCIHQKLQIAPQMDGQKHSECCFEPGEPNVDSLDRNRVLPEKKWFASFTTEVGFPGLLLKLVFLVHKTQHRTVLPTFAQMQNPDTFLGGEKNTFPSLILLKCL